MKNEKIVQIAIVLLGLLFLFSASTELQYVNADKCIHDSSGYRYSADAIKSCQDSSYGSAQAMGLLGLLCVAGFGYTVFTRKGFFSRSSPAANSNTLVSSSRPITESSSPQAQTSDIQQELQKAADMLKQGLIDEEEYKELKKKIISKS